MIEAHQLTRRFGKRTAVEDLSFEARAGEVLGLLGPNGAGKTTTIRMLAGIIAPSSGTASVLGIDPARSPERVHERIGLLTEAPGFYERLSARRNLTYFAGFYPGLQVGRAVDEQLRLMGLGDRARDRVGTFSKGMKQRLALARTLLHEPDVLFLDEPTAGLDPEAAKELRELILRLRSQGRSILLSTHNLSEAEALCDRIAVFHSRLVALDTPQALRDRQFAPRVRVAIGNLSDAMVKALAEDAWVDEVSMSPDERATLIVRLADVDRDRPKLVARLVKLGADVLTLQVEERSLEEVYLSLVGEGES